MEVEPKSFECNREGYLLKCTLRQKQLTLTVENHADKQRAYYFRTIFHDEDFNHQDDLKQNQSLRVYQNINNFYNVLEQKKQNNQLDLYEGGLDLIEQVGSKRSRVNIKLSEVNYSPVEMNVINQCKDLKNTLEQIQAKAKQLESQLQLYKSRENLQKQKSLKSQTMEKKLKQDIKKVQDKSKGLQKNMKEVSQLYEISKKENFQLKNKITEMEKRVLQIRKSCEGKLQNTDVINQKTMHLEKLVEIQHTKYQEIDFLFKKQKSQYDLTRLQNENLKKRLQDEENQKKKLKNIIDQNEKNRLKIQIQIGGSNQPVGNKNLNVSQNYSINNQIMAFSAQHLKSCRFVVNKNTLKLVAQNKQVNWMHMLSTFIFKSGSSKYSYKIISSQSDNIEMVFGISNFLKDTQGIVNLASHQRLCFIGYNTRFNGMIQYGNTYRQPIQRNSSRVGDTITISVDLSKRTIFWTKNHAISKLGECQIPESMCKMELYPTILMRKKGDTVEVAY